MLRETLDSLDSTTLNQFYRINGLGSSSRGAHRRKLTLQEERQEGDNEHQEDTDDRTVDPVEDRLEVIASAGADECSRLAVLAQCQLRVQCSKEDH